MASTLLADLLLPTTFSDYVVELTKEKSALIRSGVAVINGTASKAISDGPDVFTLRRYKDVTGPDDLIPTDEVANPLVEGDFEKFETFEMRAVAHARVKPWSEQSLAAELNGERPLDRLAHLAAAAWARTHQKMAISALQGVIAAGEAAAAGTYSFVSGVTDAELTNNSVIKAWDLVGDSSDDFLAIAMHSKVFHRLQQLNLITDIPNSRGEVAIRTYLGKQVIVDDGMPVDTVPDPDQYSIFLMGAGLVQTDIGTGAGLIPDEIDREPGSGQGGGRTNWYSRRRMVAHPYGSNYTGTTDGDAPTIAEMATATNWTITAPERKQVRVVELKAAATLAD